MDEFWELVAARRRAAGITQQELAERAGLSVGAVRDIEQGRTKRPRPAAARRLFSALGLSEADLAPYLTRPGPEGWRFRVLGELDVSFGDRTLDPGPPKQRAVLAVLALSPNTLIHRDAIAEAVWGAASPSAHLIPTYLSQLRQALNPSPARRPQRNLLVSDGPRYRLAVTDSEHDLLEFRRLVRQAAATGDPTRSAELYEQALRLFRGDPVADLDSLHNLAEVAAIRIERVRAVLAFADAALTVGLHHAALPHLRATAEAEPLHGGVQARLIRALAADGQVSTALQHFQLVRRRLLDELGMEPDGELVAAHEEILRREPLTLRNEPAAVIPAQLPADTADFTGRRTETAKLHGFLTVSGTATVICAVTGTGGIGKTTLAVHVAHQVRHRFPDGQLYVDLHGANVLPVPPGEALGDLLCGLGVARTDLPHTERERAAKFRSLLADRRVLVVLDNARDPAQVRPLLPGSPGCAVLVTSRHSMAVLPGVRLCRLEPLAAADAAELLCRVADVDPGSAEASAATRLARLCGGLPLALRVAGARAAEQDGLARVAERLAGEARLRELELDDLSVAATFELSVGLLEQSADHSARLFRLFGVLDGLNVSVPVAARLLDATEAEATAALDHLARVNLTNVTPAGFYGMHDLLRLYATEQAAGLDEDIRSPALQRVVHWYLATARHGAKVVRPAVQLTEPENRTDPGLSFATLAEATSWADAERDNFIALLRLALSDPSTMKLGLLALEALFWTAAEQGFSEQWEQSLQLARHAAKQLGDIEKEAYVVRQLANSVGGYDLSLSIALRREALTLARAAGDRLGEAAALINLGTEHHRLGKLSEAAGFYEEARHTVHGFDPRSEGYVLANLAAVHRDLDRTGEAVEYDEQAIAIARQVGDRHLEFDALDDLSTSLQAHGDHAAALETLRTALNLATELNDRIREATVLATMGSAYLAENQAATALGLAEKAAEVYEEIGKHYELGRALRLLGEAHEALGDHQAARMFFHRALGTLDRLRVPDADEVRALLARLP